MMESEVVAIEREVEASVVPSGTRVTLEKGETATITQSLGGTFTVVVNGNMFRIHLLKCSLKLFTINRYCSHFLGSK